MRITLTMSAQRTFSKAALLLVLLGAALALPPAREAANMACLICVPLDEACGTGTAVCPELGLAGIHTCLGGFAPNYQTECETNQGGRYEASTVGGVVLRTCIKVCV
jgi:hypothetical protein